MGINNTMRKIIYTVFSIFCIGVLALSIGLYAAHGLQSRGLLAESIKSQLRSIVAASAEKIDLNVMMQYTSADDYFVGGDKPEYYVTDDKGETDFIGEAHFTAEYKAILDELRVLKNDVGAYYIYTVMKDSAGGYRLVYDTDEDSYGPYYDYTDAMNDIHFAAFNTKQTDSNRISADVMNVDDEYGTFHTGAMPLFGADGKAAAIVCADIEDQLYAESISRFTTGIITLSIVLTAVLALFGLTLTFLLRNIKKMQDNLNKMAHYDKLTDLPNRRYLLAQLAEMTTKKSGEPFALLFIDLDNFKKVNDNAGHDAGDELLRHIASYLSDAHHSAASTVFRAGAGSLNVTARVGGDEFIMIIPGMTKDEDAAAFAEELIKGFKTQNIDKYIEKYEVGLSIGIALYPAHITNFHSLINYADAAMYYAKKAGKNCYRIYSDEMNAAAAEEPEAEAATE